MIPFDFVPPRFDEADALLREVADPVPLPELLLDDPALVDFADVLELVLGEDFPDFERDVELEPLVFEDDDPDLDPDFADLDAAPLLADDVLDFDGPPDADFELPDDLAPALFFDEEPFEDDLLVEREELDREVDDGFDPAPDDDFDLDDVDFDPPDLDAADFEAPDLELEDFLVVAMIFLRVIE